MNWLLKSSAIPLGGIVTFFGLAAFGGGINQAVLLILASIVCTGGISLLLWIPLWWVVGTITFRILGALKILKSESKVDDSKKIVISKEELALNNYIYSARAQRLTDFQIKNLLLSKGWKENDINPILSSNKTR